MSIQVPSSLAQILRAQNTFVGTSIYQIAPGATGTVRLIDAPAWLPNPVKAKAWSEIRPGQKLIVGVDDRGQYHAIAHKVGTIASQRSLQFRRYREQSLEQLFFPFKILFSVVESGVRKFYVGGDRPSASLIQGLGDSFWTRFEVLGAKKSDWLVSQLLPAGQYLAIYGDPDLNKSYAIDGQYDNYGWKGRGVWSVLILGGFTMNPGIGTYRQTIGFNPYLNNTKVGNYIFNANSTDSYQYAVYRVYKIREGEQVTVAIERVPVSGNSAVDLVRVNADYTMKQFYLLPEAKHSIDIPVSYNALLRSVSSFSSGSRTTTDSEQESTTGSASVYIGRDSTLDLEINISYSLTETNQQNSWEYYSTRTRGNRAERIS